MTKKGSEIRRSKMPAEEPLMRKATPAEVDAIRRIALAALVERLGGEVTITEDEYAAMQQRYGPGNLGVKAEYVGKELRLSLMATPNARPSSN